MKTAEELESTLNRLNQLQDELGIPSIFGNIILNDIVYKYRKHYGESISKYRKHITTKNKKYSLRLDDKKELDCNLIQENNDYEVYYINQHHTDLSIFKNTTNLKNIHLNIVEPFDALKVEHPIFKQVIIDELRDEIVKKRIFDITENDIIKASIIMKNNENLNFCMYIMDYHYVEYINLFGFNNSEVIYKHHEKYPTCAKYKNITLFIYHPNCLLS